MRKKKKETTPFCSFCRRNDEDCYRLVWQYDDKVGICNVCLVVLVTAFAGTPAEMARNTIRCQISVEPLDSTVATNPLQGVLNR